MSSERYTPKEYFSMYKLHKGDSLCFPMERYKYIKKFAEALEYAWWREKREYKLEVNNEYKVVRVTRVN